MVKRFGIFVKRPSIKYVRTQGGVRGYMKKQVIADKGEGGIGLYGHPLYPDLNTNIPVSKLLGPK